MGPAQVLVAGTRTVWAYYRPHTPHINTKETLPSPVFYADSDFVSGSVRIGADLMIFTDDARTLENLHMPDMVIRCSCLWNLDNIVVVDHQQILLSIIVIDSVARFY